eukprot:scaffold3054_cov129-Cylindrotheca_fusiformis.AAC.6
MASYYHGCTSSVDGHSFVFPEIPFYSSVTPAGTASSECYLLGHASPCEASIFRSRNPMKNASYYRVSHRLAQLAASAIFWVMPVRVKLVSGSATTTCADLETL